MVNGLDRLRHDTIIRCDDEHRDIRRLGATHTHGGKCLVARCIEEGNDTVLAINLDLDLVGTDGLCDTTGFLCRHVCLTDGIEDGGFTMIDVTHDADNRRSRDELLIRILDIILYKLGNDIDLLFLLAEDIVIHGDVLSVFIGELCVQGHHLALHKELLNDVGRLHLHLIGEILQRDHFRNRDCLDLFFNRRLYLRLNERALAGLL